MNAPALDAIIAPLHLAELRAMPEILPRLIETFRTETWRNLKQMRRAINKQNCRELSTAAHSVCGAAGSLGGYRLSGLCRNLEEMGRSGDLDAAPDVLLQILTEYKYLCDALNQVLAGACAGSPPA